MQKLEIVRKEKKNIKPCLGPFTKVSMDRSIRQYWGMCFQKSGKSKSGESKGKMDRTGLRHVTSKYCTTSRGFQSRRDRYQTAYDANQPYTIFFDLAA